MNFEAGATSSIAPRLKQDTTEIAICIGKIVKKFALFSDGVRGLRGSHVGRAGTEALTSTRVAEHHEIEMRTTLHVEDDVLDAARALAAARGVSVGAALSELARRGVAARTPLSLRNGFPVFHVPAGASGFGPDEIEEAMSRESQEVAREFLEPRR